MTPEAAQSLARQLELEVRKLLLHWTRAGHQPSVEACEDALDALRDLHRCLADADGVDDERDE